MEETKKINYKSDFDFIAKLTAMNANGESVEVGFPDYDFEVILTTGESCYASRTFVASCIKGVTKNCFNDNGQLHIVCDNHKLGVGELHAEFKAYLPNDIYPDGDRKVVEYYNLGIELITGITTAQNIEVGILLPIIYSGGSVDTSHLLSKEEAEEIYAKIENVPTKVSQLENDSKFATANDIATAIADAITNTLSTEV